MMKTRSSLSAHINLRLLIASLLFLTAGMLTLLVFAGANPLKSARTGGGGIKRDKDQPEGVRLPLQTGPVVPYSGPVVDLTPVAPVLSGKLRDLKPIDPDTVEKNYVLEPIPPKAPTQSSGAQGPIQTELGPVTSAPSPTGVNFEGVGVGLAGFSPSSNPPDVNGRVGATQYVQWNNTSFAVFNKTTGALQYGPAAGKTLFQALGGVCASHNDGDPVVSYDILAGRWVLSQFVVGGPTGSYSHQCFAVSTTSDATGEYYLYDFTTDQTNFVDYPHTGVWPDGYYMAAHVFTAGPSGLPVAVPGVFITARVYAFERDKMINGLPARMQSVDYDQEYGLLVADLDSLVLPPAGAAEFVIAPGTALTDTTETSRVKVTWDPAPTIVRIQGATVLQGLGSPPCVSGQNSPARDCVPQPPPAVPTDYLDNISNHYMYRLAYRNNGTQAAPQESLVVSGPSAGSDSTHGAVEWFEFRNAGSTTSQPTIFQTGTYDPDTNYRWLPSISMDKDGNIALGYSKSSTTVRPGIYLTGRLATDPAGTMGAEVTLQAGIGSQIGAAAGNRWGDYSAMTVDPIDQCTFYYTNEYLKTDGAFNWSTRIASYKFPSCVSAASAYGVVTGTITSAETGAPISGVRVALTNGYAGASDASGVYTILVPASTYTASAADAARNCTSASPASATVSPPGGGTVTQNFVMTGTSKLEANGFTVDDSLGGGNHIVNRAECVRVNLDIKNNGCAKATGISAKLTTTTAGVTVVDANSNYSDKAIDENGTNVTPFKISVANTFSCGTPIDLSLQLTYAGGTKTISYTVPTCAGGPNQPIPTSQLTTSDSTQQDRVGRDGFPSTCSGKTAPGGGFAGTHYYKTFTFANTSGAPRCYTVTLNAALNGPGDIESVAYDQTYDPTMLSTNYLGDSGISGLGTTVQQASYSFTVPAGHNFVVVVNTTGSATAGTIASSPFSGAVSGFVDNNPGPGVCAGAPNPTPTATVTPTATPVATATATPTPVATATATATATPVATATATATPVATATATATPASTPTATATATATATPTPTPTPTVPGPQAVNLSTRMRTDTGDNSGIGGFIITGNIPKHVVVRALGPSLTKFGLPVSELLRDPTVELHGPTGFTTVSNNNWKDSQETQIRDAGLAPTNDLESAIDISLSPGAYTAIVRGNPNGTGVGISVVEVYDLSVTPNSRLGNLSTRALVGTNTNVVIAGFILGNQSGTDRIVVRGLGPSLSGFGINNPLSDPTLEVRDQNGNLLIANNDWTDDPVQAAQIASAGLAPSNPKESAVAVTLPSGLYTAILAGFNSGQGVGTVEVYDRGP
jgi:hypothetical protein